MDSIPLMAVDATKTSHTTATREARSISDIHEDADEAITTAESRAGDDNLKHTALSTSVPSAPLIRSSYILKLASAYAILAIFAWVVVCIISHRPITTAHYEARYGLRTQGGWRDSKATHTLYVKNEDWYQAARVIQGIVAVLVIPMTSAVCSKAAVGFMQRKQLRGLTLRQTMVLADKGWSVPELYWQLVSGGFRRYGSPFLMMAICLIFLGGIITPLQSVFLTSKTIKTPTHPGQVYRLTDLTDMTPLGFGDSNLIPVLARSAITSAYNTDPQSRLWTGQSVSCSSAVNRNATSFGSQYGNRYDSDRPESCEVGGITLGNMSSLPDPFFAQLPSGYNTGLIQQFLPRINSSATNDRISEAEFPSNCSDLPGAFYMSYGDQTDLYHWSIVACMPANQTFSPWKPVRDRQDFSEALYLNISIDYLQVAYQASGFFKITMNTTAGFFELPNYMNGGIPGPLLGNNPGPLCGADCVAQGDIVPAKEPSSRLDPPDISKRQVSTNGTLMTSNSSLALEDTDNRGPLLTIAIALFGEGSFVSDRVKKPEFYIRDVAFDAPNYGTCSEQVPLQGLLRTTYNKDLSGTGLGVCLHNGLRGLASLQEQIAQYINTFYYDEEDDAGKAGRINNAFNAAGFLASEAWMTSPTIDATLDVYYDEGADTLVPVISTAGIVTISLLLAADLLALVLLSVYVWRTPRWTDQLDSFAMMRIGAAISESLPFRVAEHADRISVLDRTAGWVGDSASEAEAVGSIALSGMKPLHGRKRYAAYATGRNGPRHNPKPSQQNNH